MTMPPRKKFPVIAVVVPVAIIAVLVALLALWQFLTPADRKTAVAFSDFVTEVHAGKVDEIKIKDREYVYRVRGADGRPVVKMAIGPAPDQAVLDALKPTDPNVPAPKIYFEK